MTAVLALALLAAVILLGAAVNHMVARLGLIEVTLNEGLPPGHEERPGAGVVAVDQATIAGLLGPGVHVFLSRSCHACMRLIDELASSPLDLADDARPVHLRYIDKPRPIAVEAAQVGGAELHANQGELTVRLGADPLPYTFVVGEHGSNAQGVTPTAKHVATLANDAGLPAAVRSPREHTR